MIRLIKNYPYDNKYDYIKLFQTKSQQDFYFYSFDHILIDEGEEEGYIREGETFILDYNYDYLVSQGVNYVIWNNGHKDLYCFIYKKEYVDEELTRLYYEVDVLNTYCFDISIKNSFIERKNCDINEISDYDEGFNIGEHMITEVMTELPKHYSYFAMFNGFKNQELVFQEGKLVDIIEAPFAMNRPLTTIDGIQYPLHFMELKSEYLEPTFTKLDTSGISGGNGGSVSEGILSSKGFRFIKGMEGFAPRPYQDSGGYWTIGYGITKIGEEDIYNDLCSKVPISESLAAQTSYKLKNERYGIKVKSFCDEIGITLQHQFDALVSLAYNTGFGFIYTQSDSMYQALRMYKDNESKLREVWESYKTTSNGISLNGLKALRKEQCNMFFGKDYEVRAIPKVNTSGGISGTVTENGGNGWLP